MFSIRIWLGYYPDLSGCEALDFRRKWGLPEDGRVRRVYSPQKFAQSSEVGESFARAHFKSDSLSEGEAIPLSLLRPGEVVVSELFDLRLDPDMLPERARELFLAARLRGLQEKVIELRAQLAAEPDEDDDDE